MHPRPREAQVCLHLFGGRTLAFDRASEPNGGNPPVSRWQEISHGSDVSHLRRQRIPQSCPSPTFGPNGSKRADSVTIHVVDRHAARLMSIPKGALPDRHAAIWPPLVVNSAILGAWSGN